MNNINLNFIIISIYLILIILFLLTLLNSNNNNNNKIEDIVILDKPVAILYSITCHEEPLSLIDLIASCFYYTNVNTPIKIVVQVNEKMSAFFKQNPILIKNVYINEDHIHNNVLYTSDLLMAHVKNFKYAKKLNLSFNYFCLIASNCLFTKEINIKYLENKRTNWNYTKYNGKKNDWFFGLIYNRMPTFCNFLKKHNSEEINYQHEGAFYPVNIFEKMINIIQDENFLYPGLKDIPLEEIILPSLENYVSGKIAIRICHVFWDKPGFTPTIEDIERTDFPIVKRVNRDYNDKIRTYFRNKRI